MSYTKKTWKDGEIVTAESLNHIEEGLEATNMQYKDVEFTIPNGDTGVGVLTFEEAVSGLENTKQIVCFYIDHAGNDTLFESVLFGTPALRVIQPSPAEPKYLCIKMPYQYISSFTGTMYTNKMTLRVVYRVAAIT